MSRRSRMLLPLVAPSLAIAVSLAVGAILIASVGAAPLHVYGLLFRGTLGKSLGWGEVLYRTTQLIFTGLAVAVPFRLGLFNIGAEGQMVMGSLTMAWVGTSAAGLPPVILVPLVLLVGALAGGAWGALPGYLRARTGSHEVINTIMMNFIAMGIAGYLLANHLGVPQTVHTAPIGDGAVLPSLGSIIPAFTRSPVNVSLLLAISLGLALTVLLWRTSIGLEFRAMGANPLAARGAGIAPVFTTTLALALGGALAGLSGANTVLGHRHFFEEGLGAGTGFMGIAVALVARNHPAAVVPVAFFFGVLSYGGLVINTEVPRELVRILQALVMIMLLIAGGAGELLLRRRARIGEHNRSAAAADASPIGESN